MHVEIREFNVEYGSLTLEEVAVSPGGKGVEISTRNWPECEQTATLTRAQFAQFITECQAILAKMEE